MALKVKASVGRKRIPKNLDPAKAGYQRAINKQFKEIMDDLNSVIEAVGEQHGEAMVVAMTPIFDRSQELVPIDEGPLKASGYLELSDQVKGSIVEIGYAKAGKPEYAVFVHEMVMLNHKAPTQAKFLQQAIEEQFFQILPRLAKELQIRG